MATRATGWGGALRAIRDQVTDRIRPRHGASRLRIEDLVLARAGCEAAEHGEHHDHAGESAGNCRVVTHAMLLLHGSG